MKIMVTGGAGFIGSAVVRRALDRGLSIVNFDKLTYAANLENIAGYDAHKHYAFVRGDICDAASVRAAIDGHRPDAIMHLAAESHVDRSIDGPGAFIETNIIGTFTLLQEARRYFETLDNSGKSRFRFHHVSTDEVYGTLGATGLFTEETPYRPNSPYSASKASSDFLVRAWRETFGLPVVTSNCSNITDRSSSRKNSFPSRSSPRSKAARSRSTEKARMFATGSMSKTMPMRC